MAFQLHIRQNLDSARDHFGPGEVRRFEAPVVRVGSEAASECRLEAPEFAPCHLLLRSGVRTQNRVSACPEDGATTYLNGERLMAPRALRSGDELRVGHWTLRFQSVHEEAGRNRSFNLMSGLAKAAIALILCLEFAVVLWLPRRMREVAMWKTQIEQHRIVDLLERLRRVCRETPAPGDFDRALRREIALDLQARAEYVARYGSRLGPEQTRLLHEELTDFDRLLKASTAKALPPPLPTVALDAGIRALLEEQGRR